jgi:hypothetical protein
VLLILPHSDALDLGRSFWLCELHSKAFPLTIAGVCIIIWFFVVSMFGFLFIRLSCCGVTRAVVLCLRVDLLKGKKFIHPDSYLSPRPKATTKVLLESAFGFPPIEFQLRCRFIFHCVFACCQDSFISPLSVCCLSLVFAHVSNL